MNAIDREVATLMQRVSETAILPRYQNLASDEIDQKIREQFPIALTPQATGRG